MFYYIFTWKIFHRYCNTYQDSKRASFFNKPRNSELCFSFIFYLANEDEFPLSIQNMNEHKFHVHKS